METPRACKTISDMKVGDRFERDYIITDEDIAVFAKLSGDYNPVHFDEEYAATTIFGRRVAHGMISLAKFSGIFGMDMPGLGTLWMTQSVAFAKPVYISEPYKAVAEVRSLDRRRATISTWVESASGEVVLSGEGVVIPISEAAKRKVQNNGERNQ